MAELISMLAATAGQGGVANVDPNFNQTVLLLHGDGTNGAQNNTFLDSSTNNFTVTRNGNTTQGTFSPFSAPDGRWSNYFDGTDDYLSIADSSDFDFGSGQFCVECWFYFASREDYGSVIGQWASSNKAFKFGFTTTDALTFTYSTTGSNETDLAQTGTLSRNAWHHIVACRSGTGTNEFAIFVDGTRVHNSTLSATFYNSAAILGVGGDATGSCVGGYISNVRLVKGASVYDPTLTTITVPTNPLTAISSTVLLTAQSNRFVDSNTDATAKAVTVVGTPKVTPFSPFAPTAAYSASVNGGSGYFDGTGDYLSIAGTTALEFGTGDFCVEAWVYLTATPGAQYAQIIGRTEYGAQADWMFQITNSRTLTWYMTASFIATSTGTIPLNSWTHVAATRSGSSVRLFINGTIDGTATNSGSTEGTASAYPYSIGADRNGDEVNLTGYLSSLRAVKGSAVYTSTFTPPTAPPTNITNTSLLLNFTNAGIFDNTGKNNLETVGNAQIDTTTKKYGTGSMEFDGTGDWIKGGLSENFEFGGGDFTIECFVYFTVLPSNSNAAIVCYGESDNAPCWFFYYDSRTSQSSPGLRFSVLNATPALVVDVNGGGLSGWSSGTWYHVAVTRSGNSWRLFRDGVQTGSTVTDSDAIPNPTNTGLVIGAEPNNGAPLNGFIDDLRITKGVARYTSAFTPPTKEFPNL